MNNIGSLKMKSYAIARMGPSWLKFNGPTSHHRLRISKRFMSFTFAGPRKLDELIKKDAFDGKTSSEVKDIWYSYHEEKVRLLDIISGLHKILAWVHSLYESILLPPSKG